MTKKHGLSSSDRNAARYGMPGSQQQRLTETSIVRTATGKPVARVNMNYGGLAGGLPSNNVDELLRRAKMYEEMGAFKSAKAARMRAENIRGHARMTQQTLDSINPPNVIQLLARYFGY